MKVFFYGLFMDTKILQEKGVNATNPRKGYLEHYTLRIGERASLLPASGDRSWGLLMDIENNALDELYKEASVADYLPEEVLIITENGEMERAICYNLPESKLKGTNPAYAKALCALGKQMGLSRGIYRENKTDGHLLRMPI